MVDLFEKGEHESHWKLICQQMVQIEPLFLQKSCAATKILSITIVACFSYT